MAVNFFTWVRQSVRQAVLMGVHDAVEEIGGAEDRERLQEEIMEAIQRDEPPAAGKGRRGGRKRLGKSLKDVETVGKEAAS